MRKLEGKVVLVTGGSSGLGLATAQQCVAEGAYVFITGRRKPELDAAAQRIGNNVMAVQGDVANLADLDRLFTTIADFKGTLDVVFANAGAGLSMPLGTITEEQYHQIFDANVKGMLFTVQKALPLLKDGSSIILNASMMNSKAREGFSVYAASKAAVRNFARGWTLDLKARRIRVNAISPGVIVTEGFKQIGLSDDELEEMAAQMVTTIPAGRTGRPDEIAKAVVFLASDDSSYITATELAVDGGLTGV